MMKTVTGAKEVKRKKLKSSLVLVVLPLNLLLAVLRAGAVITPSVPIPVPTMAAGIIPIKARIQSLTPAPL